MRRQADLHPLEQPVHLVLHAGSTTGLVDEQVDGEPEVTQATWSPSEIASTGHRVVGQRARDGVQDDDREKAEDERDQPVPVDAPDLGQGNSAPASRSTAYGVTDLRSAVSPSIAADGRRNASRARSTAASPGLELEREPSMAIRSSYSSYCGEGSISGAVNNAWTNGKARSSPRRCRFGREGSGRAAAASRSALFSRPACHGGRILRCRSTSC